MINWFRRNLVLLIFTFVRSLSFGQADTLDVGGPKVILTGFLDVFYCYDFNKPETNYRQTFLYNHNRHNEFNLNLGFIKVGVEQTRYRANLALQAGTYANDNYALEPGSLKHIFEANAGVKLSGKKEIWLDAGIFSSHIGFESAVSPACQTLTRSLVAESSPYFLTGAKLTWIANEKWELGGIVSNGWQRIQRVAGNSLPCFGTQVKYIPGKAFTLNWSTLMGTDDPDSTRRMRYFNNLYALFQLANGLDLTLGFDAGMQQQSKGSSAYNTWYAPVAILKYGFSREWAMAFRAEYYHDKAGVIVPTGTPEGFKTTGFSLNLDYKPAPDIACRIEGRYFDSRDKIFKKDGSYTHHNFFITGSIAVQFQKIFDLKQ